MCRSIIEQFISRSRPAMIIFKTNRVGSKVIRTNKLTIRLAFYKCQQILIFFIAKSIIKVTIENDGIEMTI
jgi:hypothetical protein